MEPGAFRASNSRHVIAVHVPLPQIVVGGFTALHHRPGIGAVPDDHILLGCANPHEGNRMIAKKVAVHTAPYVAKRLFTPKVLRKAECSTCFPAVAAETHHPVSGYEHKETTPGGDDTITIYGRVRQSADCGLDEPRAVPVVVIGFLNYFAVSVFDADVQFRTGSSPLAQTHIPHIRLVGADVFHRLFSVVDDH